IINLSMGKIMAMFAMRISRALMAMMLVATGCVCVNAEESASVTISGTVLTESGGKPLKKAKVRVFLPNQDYVGINKSDKKSGEFNLIVNGSTDGARFVLQPVDKNEKPEGALVLLENKYKNNATNADIIGMLAESSIVPQSDCGSVVNAVLSIPGVYGDHLNFFHDHKVVYVYVDGKRWTSKMQQRVSDGVMEYYTPSLYIEAIGISTGTFDNKGSDFRVDLNATLQTDDVVRIDYLTSRQSMVLGQYAAPGGVILITTKADPEMKWVDNLRLTMVEL
ncbi:MAG: hypothetical protein K2M76_00540, partial [Muribaculaceae bacterium]|nr:hypothetical protein [Muribaculaceae bacterium]